MKNTIFILAVSLITLTTPFASHAEIDLVSKKIPVKGSMKDADGDVWKYNGWIEIGGFPPTLEHWDIWITLPDGTRKHFVGMAYSGGGNRDNPGDNNGPLGYQMHLYNENSIEEDLNFIPWNWIIQELNQIASNTDPNN